MEELAEDKIEWEGKLKAQGRCKDCHSKVYRSIILLFISLFADDMFQNMVKELEESRVFK